jgi:hypothetical protein
MPLYRYFIAVRTLGDAASVSSGCDHSWDYPVMLASCFELGHSWFFVHGIGPNLSELYNIPSLTNPELPHDVQKQLSKHSFTGGREGGLPRGASAAS